MIFDFRAVVTINILFLMVVSFFGCQESESSSNYKSNWPKDVQRTWIGPEYWANPLQDWEIENGRLKCLVSDYNRNVSLLTWEKSKDPGSLSLSVRLGITEQEILTKAGWVGFQIGKKGQFGDNLVTSCCHNGFNLFEMVFN